MMLEELLTIIFSHQEELLWQFHAFHCLATAFFCFNTVFLSIVYSLICLRELYGCGSLCM